MNNKLLKVSTIFPFDLGTVPVIRKVTKYTASEIPT
jgi:hypothetical protein